MSHFLYIHPCMAGTPNVWKVGVTKTPYSAVRGRQKYTWTKFGLTDLYFGDPVDIARLEQRVKKEFKHLSGKVLQGYGMELFQIDKKILKQSIASHIERGSLRVKQFALKEPYTASISGHCPFGIPGESEADQWLHEKFVKMFKSHPTGQVIKKRVFARNMFPELYEYNSFRTS